MLLNKSDLTKQLLPRSETIPFIRWPGGKRWLMPKLQKILWKLKFKRFFEPFLGGGAFYFFFAPSPSVLSDVNPDLINTYIHVRDHATQLLEELQRLNVTESTYKIFRSSKFDSSFYRAVRFLYLNRTAFSGMYRVNSKGEFNVPFGDGERTVDPLWKNDLLVRASKTLRGARILCADFEEVIAEAGSGDLVYCDPTYTVSHNNNGFRRYNESKFSWHDQERLAGICKEAARRGCTVIVSNACHNEIKALYRGAKVYNFKRWSGLASKPDSREMKEEYVFLLSPGMAKFARR